MSDRPEKLRQAFLRLDGGSVSEFATLFADDAQWLGVPGSGVDGHTPT